MKEIICIYHGNCADGFGAAWSIRHALGDTNIEYYPGVYQQEPPCVDGKIVIMVDFSYKKAVIELMAQKAQSILIIDHHKSAKDDLCEYPEPPYGSLGWLPNTGVYVKFDMEKSGAMLAWEYFHENSAPDLISHIQDRDLWQFKLAQTREIQASVFSYPYDFVIWDRLIKTPIQELAAEGHAIERKHQKDVTELVSLCQRPMDIGGYTVPVASLPYTLVSDAAHAMCQGKPFAACYWDIKDLRIFGLRSSDDGIDVSEIAILYGGGGHKNSAGFSVTRDHWLAKA